MDIFCGDVIVPVELCSSLMCMRRVLDFRLVEVLLHVFDLCYSVAAKKMILVAL
jgi:hypothetical protein